jgi:hypothetical protein
MSGLLLSGRHGLAELEFREPQLRKDLTNAYEESIANSPYLISSKYMEDILSVLRNTHNPLAVLIADSWESVSKADRQVNVF